MTDWAWDYNPSAEYVAEGLPPREFDILGGRGFISFLAVPRHECVYVCNVTWYG
ncbi:hypothetical protein ABZ835_16950 [Streptomyces sp. NPDC047461]|uniref:hypothetical protein n=1 Tax=Streptomyces sp. NPDC047461 TaxID=3155619 RepID=UPI0033C33F56